MDAADTAGREHAGARYGRNGKGCRHRRGTIGPLCHGDGEVSRGHLAHAFAREESLQLVGQDAERRDAAHDRRNGRKRSCLLDGRCHSLRRLAIGGNREPLRQHGAFEGDDGPAGGECLCHRREHANPG